MHESYDFLQNLALVLCVAAFTTVIFQRLKQPVVFGYLLAGMIIGPHVPIPLAVDEGMVHTLSELGVILLMFGLGLEFSLRKLIKVGPTAGVIAVLQCSALVWIGYVIGRAFGWTPMESVYAGAAIAISSTTIIVKAFAEQGEKGKYTDIVFGVLIIEDIIAIFLLAILTAVSAGSGVSIESLGSTAARLIAFLIGLIGIGLLTIPRLIRMLVRLDRPETTLVASIGICFAAALLALSFGYSVALGAFIAGSLVAESGEEKTVEHLVAPVRDMFAAVFFVAVGMMIDPALVLEHWPAVIVLTIAVIVGKFLIVTLGAFLVGYSPRTSVQTGMSLTQIGEFSFIIAGVGLASGATRPFLYPVAVAVSAITTLSTPWFIRVSGPVAMFADRKLPKPLQTFVSLYGSWIENIRSAPAQPDRISRSRRLIRLILLDGILMLVVVLFTALDVEQFAAFATETFKVSPAAARLGLYIGAGALVMPLAIGLIRSARMLGAELALRALPDVKPGSVDFAAAPRRALVVTLQLAIVCIVGIPLIAITQPFLPPFGGGAVFLVVLLGLGFLFWRSTTNLHGHARAGAEVIVAALAQQMAPQQDEDTPALSPDDQEDDQGGLAMVHQALPGLGEPVRIRIHPESVAAGQTLAQLNLRGLTGATVLAITRGEDRVVLPVGREVIHAGDLLAIAGTHDAVEAAREILKVRVHPAAESA